MNYNKFSNLSCYEEFEIQSVLLGISKIDVLKNIGHQIDDYYFFVSNDGIFNWFDLKGNHVKYPGILKELKAKHILKNITKCIIPDTITTIGYYAFSDCKLLTSITIPDSVTHIGYKAFSHCYSLKEINIPDSVTYIGYSAFSNCISLKQIIIPDSVENIGEWTFYSCESLTSITIPNSVTSIGNAAFYDCISLKEIIFKGKTLDEVKHMENYPFGIEDENVFKCEI